MNNITNHNQPQSVKPSPFGRVRGGYRFRRWSRAGYAMFRSLSLCVTMGKLSADVCEKAFLKLKGIMQKVSAFVLFEKNSAEEENPDELVEQYQLECLLINNTTNTKIASNIVIVVFMCLAVGIRKSYFNRFCCKLLTAKNLTL